MALASVQEEAGRWTGRLCVLVKSETAAGMVSKKGCLSVYDWGSWLRKRGDLVTEIE